MKERKPMWRTIVIWLVVLGIIGLISYFAISNLVGQNYQTISTNVMTDKIYESKKDDGNGGLEDSNDIVIYAYDYVEDGNRGDLKVNVAEKDVNGTYTKRFYQITTTSEYFNQFTRSGDVAHSGLSVIIALDQEITTAKAITDPEFTTKVKKDEIGYNVQPYVQNGFISWLPTIISVVAFVLIGFFFFRMLSSAGGSNAKAMDFNKSTARKIDESKVKFSDVAGCDEEKAEMVELVDYLKDPKKFTKFGAKLPKGVLLVGPPGTGKTLLAKAVAGEAKVPFFSISGSDFVEMFVGVGAGRVRDLFKNAKQNAPCIIFIDEIDAVGRQRGAGMGGGNDEREQTLNQLLVELDGFEENSGIIVIAATNRDDVLDPALLRAGRFDRKITVSLPDRKGREAILRVHAKNKHFENDVDFSQLAKRTVGFSGADLANILNESAILAVRGKRELISTADIDEAIDRRIAGPAKSSKGLSEKEREMVAYHESGHAIIGLTLEHANKVRKITIIPRGNTGGHVLMGPDDDRFLATKSELEAEIVGYLGGRTSEEIFFKDVSTGASNDIEVATNIARSMVVEYGMSSLGPIQYEKNTGSVFLGRDYANAQKNFSVSVADEIDKEVRKIIDAAHEQATKIITERKEDVELIAKTLLEFETINEEEIDYLLKNREMPKETIKQRDSAKSMASEEMQKKISSDAIVNGEDLSSKENEEEKKEDTENK